METETVAVFIHRVLGKHPKFGVRKADCSGAEKFARAVAEKVVCLAVAPPIEQVIYSKEIFIPTI